MLKKRQLFDRLGLGLWGLGFLAAAIQAAVTHDRAVVPVYRRSVEHFFAFEPLYNLELSMGFLYAPSPRSSRCLAIFCGGFSASPS
jgi:hypothetical protein